MELSHQNEKSYSDFSPRGNTRMSELLCRSANWRREHHSKQRYRAQSRSKRAHNDPRQSHATSRGLCEHCHTSASESSRIGTLLTQRNRKCPSRWKPPTACKETEIHPCLPFYFRVGCLSDKPPQMLKHVVVAYAEPLPPTIYHYWPELSILLAIRIPVKRKVRSSSTKHVAPFSDKMTEAVNTKHFADQPKKDEWHADVQDKDIERFAQDCRREVRITENTDCTEHAFLTCSQTTNACGTPT